MKFVRFSQNDQGARLGILSGDTVRDLRASYAATLARRGVLRAPAIAAVLFPASTRAFLEAAPVALEAIATITEWVALPLDSVRLHAPIADPGKIICIGLNYRDHAEEAGMPIPPEPPMFPKWTNAILDPGEPILRPRGCEKLDWEVELGVVIGRPARYVSRDQALDHVFGYTIVNDVSARDFQFVTSQWAKGKIPETFAPLGPCIADREEIPDPHRLELRTFVNGALMQNGSTTRLIFDVAYLVSYLSGLLTLSPGDLIATGTPPGVGMGMKPPRFMGPGDVCRLEITGIGVLENPVKDA
jgi:2-keto-4-pentenoate hydratase/2-oxohepta-3-ene-1,7-dioic acid hydratase in catechol pathway